MHIAGHQCQYARNIMDSGKYYDIIFIIIIITAEP
jgi:hypothetical protein